ncbi:MAG: YeeE/YedE thiosulfate transporter family protein [Chloroflexota bacterium]|nr:YeeE/YedE thiosulfate transporter family protein [Chloroflexota bacterium]
MTTATHTTKNLPATAESDSKSQPRPFVNPYLGGLFMGVVLFLSFFLTGNGLGASGGLNRLIIWAIDLVAPEHVDRVSYLIHYAGGDKNAMDHWIVLMTVGILLGGLISGLVGRRVKAETVRGPRITDHQRWLFALIGGVIAGFGARMARGCTSGQGLSGGATLSVGSWAFLLCFFVGGYALAYFVRKLWT